MSFSPPITAEEMAMLVERVREAADAVMDEFMRKGVWKG
jgi:hypothetical protein